MTGKLNGATVPTIIVTAIVILFGLMYNLDRKVGAAMESVEATAKVATRNEATGDLTLNRLDRMEDKIDRLLERGE